MNINSKKAVSGLSWISAVRFIGVFAAALFLLVTPSAATRAAGGLVICGSDSQEQSLATAVNTSGGSAASLTAFNSPTNGSCQLFQLVPEITHIINWLIASAGLLAVFWIVLIGFRMVISRGDAGAMKSLRQNLESVLLGLVLVMLAFVLVNTLYSIFNIKINGATGFTFNPFGQ